MKSLAAQTDFDLHGIVGIRLLNANADEISMVIRQLGPIQKPLNRKPDIIIEFVDHLETSERILLIGVDDAGFTDDAFLVMRSKHKSKAKVQIPFADIGQQHCKIIVERGLPAIPLLIAIINVTMVAKGALPLHASAFEYQNIGVLATGWAKGGKTETLLSFAAHGARYIGDEWVYLRGDEMYGIPEPIRLWSWHFEEMPQYQAMLSLSERAKLKSLNTLTSFLEQMTDLGITRKTLPMKLLRRIVPGLKRQLYVQVPPKRLFGATTEAIVSVPQKLFFVISHESPDFIVEKGDPQLIAKRMVFSLQDERTEFLGYYTRFRFAFPEIRNDFIENLADREREMLVTAFQEKEIYVVYHPFPVSIPALYEVLKGFFSES